MTTIYPVNIALMVFYIFSALILPSYIPCEYCTNRFLHLFGSHFAATTSLHLKEEKIKDDDNHTTTGSLIIALAFGILFFLAVLVLIGRPWWFSFRRPRYSKVDYLMNGL